mgnify:CR=1 FL=1
MFWGKSAQSLRSELAAVEEQIAAHPLSDPSVKRAHEIIEGHRPGDNDAIAAELEGLGLRSMMWERSRPSTPRVGGASIAGAGT